MAVDIASLEPQIRRILTSPHTDLTTISAKRVRQHLLESDPSLSAAFLKANKDAVDVIIAKVFDQVSGRDPGDGSEGPGVEEDAAVAYVNRSPPAKKRKKEVGDGDDDGGESASPSHKKRKKAKKKPDEELSDSEVARKLSSEINRSGRIGKVRAGVNGSPRKSRKVKSSELVDSDGEEDGKIEKKKTTGRGGFSKEYVLSEALAAVVKADKLSRPQVVKHLWGYIKDNELQNPQNKKEILCDEYLKAVFRVDKVDSFKMNKFLSQHLHESES